MKKILSLLVSFILLTSCASTMSGSSQNITVTSNVQGATCTLSNDKGTWFGWEVSKVGPVTDKGLYDQAKAFSENISKGSVKAKHGEDKPKDQASII